MFQLYLLTVITTILAGHALASEFLNTRFKRFSEHTGFVNNGLYRIILGSVSILIGLINLFPSYPGDIAVLGDLLPSLAGIGAGVLLWLTYIQDRRSAADAKAAEPAEKGSSKAYLNIIGLLSIVIGILHAVFPKAPLL